jgi:hypothetical protein
MWKLLLMSVVVCVPACAQVLPTPNQLTSSPYVIQKTWIVGGSGNWSAMTLDPANNRLYIAHDHEVQVIDIETGKALQSISGLSLAHSVVLDQSGSFGFITDVRADKVVVFNRDSLEIVKEIQTAPNPRSAVLDAQSGFLFVVSAPAFATKSTNPNYTRTKTASGAEKYTRNANAPEKVTPDSAEAQSTVTVIDAQKWVVLAALKIPGVLGAAIASEDGSIYVVNDYSSWSQLRDGIVRINVPKFQQELNAIADAHHDDADSAAELVRVLTTGVKRANALPAMGSDRKIEYLKLDDNCAKPSTLSTDGRHQRLFVACGNMKLAIFNSSNGSAQLSLPIGAEVQKIEYDEARGLIFVASGFGNGNLTVIKQDVTDTYSVVQNLPTKQDARTFALDHTTGLVYMATALYGYSPEAAPGLFQKTSTGPGGIRAKQIDASFQVIVVGN